MRATCGGAPLWVRIQDTKIVTTPAPPGFALRLLGRCKKPMFQLQGGTGSFDFELNMIPKPMPTRKIPKGDLLTRSKAARETKPRPADRLTRKCPPRRLAGGTGSGFEVWVSKPSSLAVAHCLRQAPQARPPRSTPPERWAARRVEAYIRSRTPSHPSLCLVDAQQLSVPSFALAGSYGNLYCPFPVNGSS